MIKRTPVDLDALERQWRLAAGQSPVIGNPALVDWALMNGLELVAELRASRKVIEAVRHDNHPISREVAEAFVELGALNDA